MKIITVHYSALVNTGNYENEKIGLDAQVEEGETVAQVVERLKEEAFTHLNRRDLLQERRELSYAVQELEEKLEEAQEKWEQVAAFLKAQGIRPDAPDFPVPGISAMKRLTTSEHVHAELVEEGNPDDGE